MIRTLAIIAVVSFVLALACLATAFAITGGPFSIDDNLRFHRGAWSIKLSESAPPGNASTPA
jgi:hypothetical protein